MTLTPQTNIDLESIARFLLEHDNYVICGHVSPDGDCLGSQLALWHALVACGKSATCVLTSEDPVAASESFMPGIDAMVPASRFTGTANAFIGVDVPNRERIGKDACALLDACPNSLTIDHHASETTMCEYVFVDPDAASASMLVWSVVKLLCEKPPIESAVCAYAGLASDTGGFRFQNSDSRAFGVAAELVAYGVDPAYVATCVFQSRTLASLRLEGLVIDRLEISADGQSALSWVAYEDFERLGAVKSDAEPLIDAIRSLQGVRVACMLREQRDSKVRGSLRSKDGTDVSALAREFGGGGHKAAAGFTLDMTLDEARVLMAQRISKLART